jgi:hypothetical protein
MAVDALPIQGGTRESTYLSTFDFFKPEVALEVTRRYGQGIKAVNILRAMGRELPVGRDTWSGYEENKFHRTITLNAASGNSTDNNSLACWTFVLDGDDLDSEDNFYPRVGFIVGVPVSNDTEMARIERISVSGSTITLYCTPLDGTIVPASNQIASGTEIAILSHVKAAGTAQPDAVNQGFTKRTFYSQIIAESVEAEGSQLVNDLWMSKYDDGTGITNWYNPEFAYSEARMDFYEEGMIVAGQVNSRLTTFVQNAYNMRGTWDGASTYTYTETKGIGNKMQTSQGMFRWNSSLGNALNYSDENFVLDDLTTVEDFLVAEGVTTGVILWMVGRDLQRQIDNAGMELVSGTSAGDQVVSQYMKINGTPQLAATLGFSTIQRSGFTHIFQVIDSFSNPQTFGAGGYNYKKWGFICPLGNATIMNEHNEKITMPNMGLRYRQKNGYNRRREMWKVGAAGGDSSHYQGDHDVTNNYWRNDLGFEMYKANQTVVAKPV